MSSATPGSEDTSSTTDSVVEEDVSVGRVVRLHFRCHAELPIGSFLRVTGKSLWAPMSVGGPSDAMNAHQRAQERQVGATFPAALNSEQDDQELEYHYGTNFYASSVEMVTTPETYPLWQTKKPVVVVLNHPGSTLQHHYYRYLVVTPGSSIQDNDTEKPTTNPVMAWENPFPDKSSNAQTQSASGTSLLGGGKNDSDNDALVQLAQLPYRTLDINVQTARVVSPSPEDRTDTFNNPEDKTFQAYQIRDSMSENEQAKESKLDDSVASQSSLSRIALAPKILFICFHLPVVVVKTNEGWQATWSESLLARKEGSKIVATYRAHWIGTVTPHPPIVSEEDRNEVRKILAELNCTPIFLDPSTRQAHYYGFCKQVLWPAFHNIDLLDLSTSGVVSDIKGTSSTSSSDWDQSRLNHWWQAYRQVNQEFAQVVNQLCDRDASTYLWIHDYHLSLLPRYLNQEPAKSCRKVFFLHIPFPTSQIFRELECGEEILQGMLHADVVGFHAFDHARHFLNAAKRILGLNYESLVGGLIGVTFLSKTVLVSMSNVSIEPKMADVALALPLVTSGCQDLKEKHGDRRIICGVDIGQRLSGTSLKLLAYERLLQDYPSWQSKVVMVQRVLIPGSRKNDEIVTLRELRHIVQRIRDKFGAAVIDYTEVAGSNLPMDQRLALWKASDVLMLTPIREGLNHWPMEYIYSKSEEAPGVVIASEFSAVCSILNGALRVNPFDIQMTITIIDKALSMDLSEAKGRRYRDLEFVTNCPSDKWVKNVLRDLNDVTYNSTAGSHTNSNAATPTVNHTPTTPRNRSKRDQLRGTAAFLLKETHLAFTHLNRRTLKQAYDKTKQRVIILDFNGTIVLKEPPGKYLKREILGTSGNKPPPEVLEALTLLCRDPKNTVYVVSGDSSENVLSALGGIHQLGLGVSNGAQFSPPLTDHDSERHWQSFDLGVDWKAVKSVALPVLSKYTARSNGSFVKLTTFSIGWSYYSCDPEWGSLQASHLVLELESELKAFDVRFVTLKGVVEIVPRKLNKGLIVKKVLRDISSQNSSQDPIDFILCFGDDISDEKMFTSVFKFVAELGEEMNATTDTPFVLEGGALSDGRKPFPDPMYAYTCAVGKKPSNATSYVTDAQEVVKTLVLLAKGEQQDFASVGTSTTAPTQMFT